MPPKILITDLSPPKDLIMLTIEKDLTVMKNYLDIVDDFPNENL